MAPWTGQRAIAAKIGGAAAALRRGGRVDVVAASCARPRGPLRLEKLELEADLCLREAGTSSNPASAGPQPSPSRRRAGAAPACGRCLTPGAILLVGSRRSSGEAVGHFRTELAASTPARSGQRQHGSAKRRCEFRPPPSANQQP